jgi:hypothetical protein
LVRFAIEFPHPGPVDGLTILIHPIHRALYHVTFGWGIGDPRFAVVSAKAAAC